MRPAFRPALRRAGLAALLTAALLAGCGGAGPPAAVHSTAPSALPSPAPSRSPSATTAPAAARAAVSLAAATTREGALPQTTASPAAAGPLFRARVAALWTAVRTGSPAAAEAAFFPLAAYRQVKALADPAADWQQRLWADFALDVRAAHRLVGTGASFAGVQVPAAEAAWIRPGRCYNRIGYWHDPGARLLYRQGGVLRSFGIASLISWRGDWFVVHLGAVLRSAPVGIVDSPSIGAGVPAPAGGC